MRIGLGYDIHRLVRRRKLLLGGVEIPSLRGELGFSDGDVLIHAVIDSLLGAAGLKDIGTYFPPGDPAYRNISSRILLQETMRLIKERNLSIINMDCTIILEKPKLKPFIEAIRACLASDLQIRTDQVAVKAKTKEGIGATGKGRAAEAYAVVLLEQA